jgi:hypothetical protein
VLVSPTNNAMISQNNPAIGCSTSTATTYGLGFQVQFNWMTPSLPNGIASYEIHADRSGAPLPMVDAVVSSPNFTFTSCNAFVDDANLLGWEWRVRAKDTQGQFADWSPWASFQFSPCRLSSGGYCSPPPATP